MDTSILVELLRVPGKHQNHDAVAREMRQRVGDGTTLILPTAAIIETGNHIAQVADGGERRNAAGRLQQVLRATLQRTPPWTLHGASWDGELIAAICDGARGCPSLPEMAMRKIGAGDVSILAEAESYGRRVTHVDVRIWTLDVGLRAWA